MSEIRSFFNSTMERMFELFKRPGLENIRIMGNGNCKGDREARKSTVPQRKRTRTRTVSSTRTFHEGLVRERDKHHNFDDIYELLEEMGRGGLCTVFKIRKRDEKVGGSSRPELVRQKPNRPKLRGTQHPHRGGLRVRERMVSNSSLYFALKVFNLKLVKEDRIDQLKNEVEILKSLDHKNIIKAYETFQRKETNQLMIVMELCYGGSLYSRLPYSERQAAYVIKQILSAVSYMHEKKIIHRDIKFENILYESANPDAAIKLIDFGLSKNYLNSSGILTERVGTLYSMSPETMQGIYASKADVWSVGVCTFMMLANGEKPFDAKRPKQLVTKVLTGTYNFDSPCWGNVSGDAKDFVRNLLSIQSRTRPSAIEATRHSWLYGASSYNLQSLAVGKDMKQRVKEVIVRFADFGEFRKLALNVIAMKSTTEDIIELRKVFEEFDTQYAGCLTLEEFQAAFEDMNLPDDEIERVFRNVDINRTDVVNYTEFLAASLEAQGAIEEYRVAEAFDLMDSDDTGYISRKNLRQILGEMSDEKYIDKLFEEVDHDRDGKISYEEFLQVFGMKKHDMYSNFYESDHSSSVKSADHDLTTTHCTNRRELTTM